MAWVGGTVTSSGGNISLTIEGGYADVVRNGDVVTGRLGLRFIFNQSKWSSNTIAGVYNGTKHYAQNRIGGDDSYCSTLNSILYCTSDLESGPNYNESYPWTFSATVSGNGSGSIAITMSAGWTNWPGDTPYTYTFYVPYPEKTKVWNDINAYYPDGSTQGALKFNLSTSDGGNWSNLTNEPTDFTKYVGTTASISGITTAVTGLHYTGNNVTHSTATSFGWTFNTANWICELYSAWNTYTIKYNANGGSGSMSDTGATYNTAVTLRNNAFTRTHYTFKNWNTKADGSGVSYNNGASVSNLTATHGGTVTLYAQWTGVTYIVSYNANGGTSTPSSHSVQYPGTLTLRSAISKANTSANGYNITYNANGGSGAPGSQTSGSRTVTWPFSKWAAGSTSGSQYSAGATYQPASNITMYAIWSKNESASSSWTCSSTIPKKTGHTFLGWSESSTATSATYTAGTAYTITKGLTLYAVWQKNNYYLDVNGYLDGVDDPGLGVYGTVDVYVNGTAVANDVNDYYTQHPYGSSYEIKDIKANSGYQYNGLQVGTLSGTIGNNETTTGVRINFSTIKPSNVVINGNWTSPFNIDLNWSATGLNVKYVLYYKKSTDSNYTSIDCGTTMSKAFTAEEETTYSFYIAATNAGGTTNSNTITITTPADQAKIRRKVDGTWVKGKAYFKEEGAWVKAKKIYIKRDGVWYINTNYDS